MNTVETRTLGDKLKSRRQEIHLTLKEAETATSIRHNYLQAIEENRLLKMVPPVYAQGFIKQYSTYLGLDAEKLLREHPEVLQRSENQDFNYGIGTLEMRNSPVGGVRWGGNIVWAAAFIGIIVAAWFFARMLEVL